MRSGTRSTLGGALEVPIICKSAMTLRESSTVDVISVVGHSKFTRNMKAILSITENSVSQSQLAQPVNV